MGIEVLTPSRAFETQTPPVQPCKMAVTVLGTGGGGGGGGGGYAV